MAKKFAVVDAHNSTVPTIVSVDALVYFDWLDLISFWLNLLNTLFYSILGRNPLGAIITGTW